MFAARWQSVDGAMFVLLLGVASAADPGLLEKQILHFSDLDQESGTPTFLLDEDSDTTKPADLEMPVYVGGLVGLPAVIVIQEWWGITEGVSGWLASIQSAAHCLRRCVVD